MHQVHSDEISRLEKRALWDEIIQDYLSSGEKAAIYCERHGLKPDHLYYYVSSYRRKHSPAPQFVPIDIEANTCRPSEAIEITSGKVHISLPMDVSLVLFDAVFVSQRSHDAWLKEHSTRQNLMLDCVHE